jgi:hypothetical protein
MSALLSVERVKNPFNPLNNNNSSCEVTISIFTKATIVRRPKFYFFLILCCSYFYLLLCYLFYFILFYFYDVVVVVGCKQSPTVFNITGNTVNTNNMR